MERVIVQELGANPHGGNGHGSVLLDTVGTIALDPAYDKSHTTAERRSRRPAWWLLYIMIPLTALLFLLADQLSPTSGWRTGSEIVATSIGLFAIALWLRANRTALIMAEYFDRSEGPAEMP